MSGKFWSPLILSATVPAMVNGDDYTFNPQKLFNPNRGPMLVDQFRFSLDWTTANLARPSTSPVTPLNGINPNVFAAEIRLGSIPLMSKPITLGAFIPRYLNGGLKFTGNYDKQDNVLVWHLPKPLFVPPGVQIFVRLTAPSLFQLGTTTEPILSTLGPMRVTLAGRSLSEDEPIPARIPVPWVCQTKAQTTATYFRGSDVDLINPHDVPMMVKQFVGTRHVPDGLGIGTPYEDMTVQMTASNGIAVIRDPTPFGLLFPETRGLLEMNAVLQPGQFITVALDHPAIAPNPVGSIDTQCQFTAIGMVGYRMVDTPHPNTM